MRATWLMGKGVAASLEEVAARCPGFTSGFDYMRILLSCCVVLVHSFTSSYGNKTEQVMWSGFLGSITYLMLPMFFALSGYLVAGSLLRTQSIIPFAVLRVIRLVPALAVEVGLSALLLGALVTTLPIVDYYTNAGFFRYFLNILGHIHFRLPGVFEDLPFSSVVNISLWTIPYELECYLTLAALFLVRAVRRPAVFAFATVALNALFMYMEFSGDRAIPPPGRLLVISFLWAVTFYLYRSSIPHSRPLFIFCLLVSVGLFSYGETLFIAPAFVAYVTVYLGLLNPPKIFGADYSYGVYLYSFPIQQTYTHLFPDYRIWWLNLLVCLPLAFLFAAFSWNFIERPILHRRKDILDFVGTAQARLRRFRRQPNPA